MRCECASVPSLGDTVGVRSDVRWGLNIGLKMAGFYTVVGTLVLLMGRAPGEQALLLAAVYFAAGIVGGITLGLFRTQAKRSRRAAIAVGILIAFPAASIITSILPFVGEDPTPFPVVAFMAVFFGTLGGVYFGPQKPAQ